MDILTDKRLRQRVAVPTAPTLWLLWDEFYGEIVIYGLYTSEKAARAAQKDQNLGLVMHCTRRDPKIYGMTLNGSEYSLPWDEV